MWTINIYIFTDRNREKIQKWVTDQPIQQQGEQQKKRGADGYEEL